MILLFTYRYPAFCCKKNRKIILVFYSISLHFVYFRKILITFGSNVKEMKLLLCGILTLFLFLASERREEKSGRGENLASVLSETNAECGVAGQSCGKNFFHPCKNWDELLAYTVDLSGQYKGVSSVPGGMATSVRNVGAALLSALKTEKYSDMLSVRYLHGFYVYFLQRILI